MEGPVTQCSPLTFKKSFYALVRLGWALASNFGVLCGL